MGEISLCNNNPWDFFSSSISPSNLYVQGNNICKRIGIRAAKLLQSRELHGDVIPSKKGKCNFEKEYLKVLASQPLVCSSFLCILGKHLYPHSILSTCKYHVFIHYLIHEEICDLFFNCLGTLCVSNINNYCRWLLHLFLLISILLPISNITLWFLCILVIT